MITSSPFQEAVDRMKGRTPIAVALRSDEWADVPLELRDRAFWTAQFASADLLQLMHDKITTALEMGKEQVANGERFVSRSSFIGDIRTALSDAGYIPPVGKEGSLQDHSSRGRLGLIYDINTQMAQEFGNWKVGQDPAILDRWPAQELYREMQRKVPRRWHVRWAQHGGREFGGRMIARKNDPIWSAISAFGNPYPPFDYNSGMGIRDIGRAEAEKLGVIRPGEKISPAHKGFNDTLSLSSTNLTEPLITKLQSQFGDQVVVEHHRAQWKANLIPDFVAHAIKNPNWQGNISLGTATKATVQAAREYADLSDYTLLLNANEARHVINQHGSDKELQRGQVKLTPEDFSGVADLWRFPDVVLPGDQNQEKDSLEFKKEERGILTMVTWRLRPDKKTISLHSLWKEKGGAL